jgi:hypothetical protein
MRCEQAEMLGFKQIESWDMATMLMGQEPTDQKERDDMARQTYEYLFNHHTDEIFEKDACVWGGKPVDFYHLANTTPWFLPPFEKKEMWRCRFGKLDYLKRIIPYGVVLKIQEVKKLKLFNVFNVMAPLEAWEAKTDIDPIVVATIWQITDKHEKSSEEFNTAGTTAHFFLAQW